MPFYKSPVLNPNEEPEEFKPKMESAPLLVKILDNLYVSNISYIQEKPFETQFSHVLTILNNGLPSELSSKCQKYRFINAEDSETENLLDQIPNILEFYNDLEDNSEVSNKLLVHCHAGQSRSMFAALAILADKFQLNLQTEDCDQISDELLAENFIEDLVRHLQEFEKSSDLSLELLTNLSDNFKNQLLIFAKLNYQINSVSRSSKIYQDFRFSTINYNERNNFTAKDIHWADFTEANKNVKEIKGETVYRCSKCRHKLFKDSHIVTTTKQNITGNRKRNNFSGNSNITANYYLVPIRWMAPMLFDENLQDPMQGKLYCPKKGCNNKLGHFCWYGEQVNHEWLGPIFNISSKKADKMFIAGNKTFEIK